jgi:hypothetical protein
MQVTQPNFDSETVALMGRVCDEAWRDLQVTRFFPLPSDAVLHRMAARIRRLWPKANAILSAGRPAPWMALRSRR